MTFLKSIAFSLFLLLLCVGCQDDVPIGRPLLSLDFDQTIHNEGLAKVAVFGPQYLSYNIDKEDTCLDLSIDAFSRKSLALKFKDSFSLSDYEGFTVAVRVKKHPGDNQEYTILSQEKKHHKGRMGWQLLTQSNGAWGWQLSDGQSTWNYRPTQKQLINDGKWHQLVFSYDTNQQEARLYYDGKNVAVYSLWDNQMLLDRIPITVGASALSQNVTIDLFNGHLDDLAMWSRVLTAREIKALYKRKGGAKIKYPKVDDQLAVMTWNIWKGGTQDGKYVGVQRVLEILEENQPDILFLQEANGSGPMLADALDCILYHRSESLNLLSRYPLGRSYNLYRAENIGCIELELNEEDRLLACPVQLSTLPLIDDYVRSGHAEVDSILTLEETTRGKEIRFIMSELSMLSLKSNETPIILAGDFNSGSHLDWTAKNHVNYHDLSVQFPVSKKLEVKGFMDSYRYLYPDEVLHLGHTWSPRFDSVLHNRTDYIYFKGEKLLPIGSHVIEDHLLGFPSDHAALFSSFQWMPE